MSALPILTYHALDDSGLVTATKPSWFRTTMAALHAEGFRCVDLAEWVDAGRPEVERGFAIAFDDGLASTRCAADVLARHGFKATQFLVTGRMGGRADWDRLSAGSPLLRWDELSDLQEAGFRFGAHTVTHPHLTACPAEQANVEILRSKQDIEDHTSDACQLFAYPFGEAPRSARAIVGEHFAAGFTTRLAYATERQRLAAISRIDAHYFRTPERFRALLAGRCEALLRVRRLTRAARRGIAIVGSAFSRYPPAAATVPAD